MGSTILSELVHDTTENSAESSCSSSPARLTNARSIIAIWGGTVMFGQERANIEVLKALKNSGCQITIFMRDEESPGVNGFEDRFRSLGFQVLRGPFCDPISVRHERTGIFRSLIAPLVSSVRLWRHIRLRECSVIYLFNSYYSLTILPFLWLSQTPVIFRAGDVPPMHNWLFRLLWRNVCRSAQATVAVSRYIQTELTRFGMDAAKISVIYSRPRPPAYSERVDINLAPILNAPKIVYLGQITKEKGLNELTEAFGLLIEQIDCRLHIIGRIDDKIDRDAYARDLRDRIMTDPKMRSKVQFIGFIEDVYTELRTATVHVQPSLWQEPLANSVMEAKLMGVPSVVFPSGGLPEVIADGINGTVTRDKSAKTLADAIAPYLLDPDLSKSRGQAAKSSLSELGADEFEIKWQNIVNSATIDLSS